MDYDKLVAEHKDAVYRQMMRVCGNHEDAEDALVEALLSAYRALDQLRDEGNFRAWLAMIARRVCTRIKRREALMPIIQFSQLELGQLPETPADDPLPDEEVEKERLYDCVQKAIEQLPDIYRDVYVLREIQGVQAPEVGRRLNLSVPAVKSRLHRAREMVRRALDSDFCRPSLN